MRIVIVGASRFGVATARELLDAGHEVVLIDKNADWLAELGGELDCGMVHGDGTLPSILRDAFGDHADALVLLTNEDDVNILAAVVGKSVGFERVVPQIIRHELLAVCQELKLDDLITPHATVAQSIVRSLEKHNDASVDLRARKGLSVLSYPIGGRHAGKTVGDLRLPAATRVVARTRGDTEDLVDDGTELQEGDHLLVAVADQALDRMDELFGEETGESED